MSNADALPLREKFTAAERLTREFIEHLEQGFLSNIKELRRVCRKDEESGVTDKTVRFECNRLFESDKFAANLQAELGPLFDGIVKDMDGMVYGG